METGLFFQNLTTQRIWVGFAYNDPIVGASNYWRKHGWWSMEPGTTNPPDSTQFALVMNRDLRTVNTTIYFEAEFAPDVSVWPAPGQGNASTKITDNSYNQGWYDQTGCDRMVDFTEVQLLYVQSVTIQLGPNPGQWKQIETIIYAGPLGTDPLAGLIRRERANF